MLVTSTMNPEQQRIRAQEAKQLLENPILKDAFSNMEMYLDGQILGCNPDDPARTQRVVIAKQILAGIKREITRLIDDGAVAEIQLAELEQKKRLRFFQR